MRTRNRAYLEIEPDVAGVLTVPGFSFITDNPKGSLERAICFDSCHPGPPYRDGDPLMVYQHIVDKKLKGFGKYHEKSWIAGLPESRVYNGGFYPLSVPYFELPSYSNLSLDDHLNMCSDVTNAGPTGWKKFKPDAPHAQAAIFLGQYEKIVPMLRDTAKGFSDLWRSMGGDLRSFTPKSLANHWLNTQFGWVPFLHDLRRFRNASAHFRNNYDQARINNGRWIRRHGSVSASTDQTILGGNEAQTAHQPSFPGWMYYSDVPGNYQVLHMKSLKTWFSASFKYYVPNIDTSIFKQRFAVEDFGAMPSPYAVWELIPWSWLVDWFSNAGDVMSNMTDGWASNLVADYAFIMGTIEDCVTLESVCNTSPVSRLTWSIRNVWKLRQGASPFGFGLNIGDFTPYQASILTALGLTHSR